MFKFFPLASVFLILGFTACSTDAPSDEGTEEAQVVPAKSEAFAPAAEALARGASAAEIGSLLMQRFETISDPNTGMLNPGPSKEFIELATKLADKYPADTLAALPLYRAAEVARALNNPQLAAAMYERVHDEYKAFSKAPESLFMAAFTYDENLNNLDKARETYEKFLAMYPDNVFAESTPMLLDNLGKSDEEILRQLEEKKN